MKTRTIKMLIDGRTFTGTPVEILTQMRSLAFGWDERPMSEYLLWLSEQIRRQKKKAPVTQLVGNEAQDCAAILDAMLAVGLVMEVV